MRRLKTANASIGGRDAKDAKSAKLGGAIQFFPSPLGRGRGEGGNSGRPDLNPRWRLGAVAIKVWSSSCAEDIEQEQGEERGPGQQLGRRRYGGGWQG